MHKTLVATRAEEDLDTCSIVNVGFVQVMWRAAEYENSMKLRMDSATYSDYTSTHIQKGTHMQKDPVALSLLSLTDFVIHFIKRNEMK